MNLHKIKESSGSLDYENYHADRFKFVLKIIYRLDPNNTVEIGPYTISHNMIKGGFKVDSIGFLPSDLRGISRHYSIDIETIGLHPEKKLRGFYDMVVFSEVIEHLRLGLDTIFTQLSMLVRPGGYVIIQTPNAVSLKKRVFMLFGYNPFDLIIDDYIPGHGKHLREFTTSELVSYAKKNGFTVKEKYIKNYFGYKHSWKARLYKIVCDLLPAGFKDGITLVLQKLSNK